MPPRDGKRWRFQGGNEEWVNGVKVRVNYLGYWLRHHGDKYTLLYIGHDKETAIETLLGICWYINDDGHLPPSEPPV